MTKRQRLPKFSHKVITSAPGLLPMLYKPSELEEEVGLPARSLRDWLDLGLPHERDPQGHIWIKGTAFSDWVATIRRQRRRTGLREGEAYCLKCRRSVMLVAPSRHALGRRVIWKGTCPECGSTINRGGRLDPPG